MSRVRVIQVPCVLKPKYDINNIIITMIESIYKKVSNLYVITNLRIDIPAYFLYIDLGEFFSGEMVSDVLTDYLGKVLGRTHSLVKLEHLHFG